MAFWRSSGRLSETVSQSVLGNYAPLSALHKRLVDTSLENCLGQEPGLDGIVQAEGPASLWCHPTPPALVDPRNSAVHRAFDEWSRQSDLALLPVVLPLDLGIEAEQKAVQSRSSLLHAFWEQQDLQLLHSLLQEPAAGEQQATRSTPAPAGAPGTTGQLAGEPLQEQQLLWDVQDAARASPAAVPGGAVAARALTPAVATADTAQLAVDALLAASLGDPVGPGGAAAADGVQQHHHHASPFTQPLCAGGPGAHCGPALHQPTLLSPEHAGMPAFPSPFAGATVNLAPPPAQQAAQLHAPSILPGYQVLPVAASTASHTPHTSPNPSPRAAGTAAGPLCGLDPSAPAVLGMQAADNAADATMLQAPVQGQDPFCAPAAAGFAQQHSPSLQQPTVQHFSPFQAVAPWELLPAAAGSAYSAAAAEIAAAQEAARAAAALPQGLWGMDVGPGPAGGQDVRQGRGVRRQGAGAGGTKKKKLHSSTKTKMQIKALSEQHEVLLAQYQAEAALNAILQQRWAEVSDALDAALLQELQQQAAPPPVFATAAAATAAAAAAAAAYQPHAGCSAGAAAAAVAVPAGPHDAAGLDALAAAVQAGWTTLLSQLMDLLPVLDRGSTNSANGRDGHQQPQQQQGAVGPSAAAAVSAAAAGEFGQGPQQPTARQLLGDDGLLSPFATGAGDGAAAECPAAGGPSSAAAPAAPAAAPMRVDAVAPPAALGLPFRPDGCLGGIRTTDNTDEVSSPTGSDQSDGSSTSSESHGVKRRRSVAAAAAAAGAGRAGNQVCADLSLLLSASLSLRPPCAKHARVERSSRLTLTESDMRLLFSSLPSDNLPSSTLLQQRQQLGGSGPGSLGASASLAAAQACAGNLVDSLWGLFQSTALLGPGLLYRCFGPRVAYCPCCCSREQAVTSGAGQPRHSMMALLLDEGADGVCAVGGATAAAAAAGMDASPAAAGTAACGACAGLQGFAQAVPASLEHWQRVKACLQLTPGQQEQLQQLWTGLQSAHAPFAARRLELLSGLQQQSWSTGGLLGVAWFDSGYAVEAAAAVTDGLLGGIDDSLAADYGVLLETCRQLWGDESPLTLVQKAKCLVASYPFWPDYSLLQCLAEGSSSNSQAGPSAAAAAGQA